MLSPLLFMIGKTTLKAAILSGLWLVSDPVYNLKVIALAAAATKAGSVISSHNNNNQQQDK